MNGKVLARFLGAALIMSFIPVSLALAAPGLSSHLYLEARGDLPLFVPTTLATGARALTPAVTLPEESIVAIDVRLLALALNSSQNSLERVNFPYVNSASDTELKRNGKGWVCGLRVVDATDEDIRESSEIDRQDFCFSLENLNQISAMDTNHTSSRSAFESFMKTQDLSELNVVASEVERQTEDRENNGMLFPMNNDATLISPLRDCGKGCLVVTSEFGMRKHPVLRQRRMHKGVDLRAKIGSPVVSALKGTVLANRTEYGSGGKGKKKRKVIKGYGHYVIVVHPEANMETLYAHLSAFRSKAGTEVQQGTVIALSGNTGIGTAPHLHFETHVPSKKGRFAPANPRTFIGNLVGTIAAIFEYFSLHA